MQSSEKDQAEGALRQLKGKVEEGAGKLVGDRELEVSGAGDVLAGEVQEEIGKVKKVFGQ